MDINEQLEQLKKEFKLLYMSRRPFLFALVVIMAAFGVGYFLTYMEYDKISLNQEKNNSLQEEIDDLEQQKITWQQALNDPSYQELSALVSEVLPSRKPILETIYIFDQLLQDYPVQISKFEFAPGEVATSGAQRASATQASRRTQTGRNYLVINLNVSGTYEALMDFLRASEAAAPIGSISTAQISKGAVGNQASARVVYHSFFYDQPTNQTAAASLPKLSADDRTNLASLSAYIRLRNTAAVEQGDFDVDGIIRTDLFERSRAAATDLPSSVYSEVPAEEPAGWVEEEAPPENPEPIMEGEGGGGFF